LLRLVKFADILICNYGFAIPNDYVADDIVQLVIEKNLSNSRGYSYDPSKGSFMNWLRMQIDSEIKNKFALKRNKSEISLPVDENGDYNEEKIEHLIQSRAERLNLLPHILEEIMISEETAEEVWSRVYEIVDGDSELESLIVALENGCDAKPQSLAEELGWSVDTVNNAKKRLRRRFQALEGKRRTK
jgi:DNA-directed RNA polymerase specialized sigma24 family protein